jgi:hypothetical protein
MNNAFAQNETDSFSFNADTSYVNDSLYADSVFYQTKPSHKSFGLLDTISNDTILNQIFKGYNQAHNAFIQPKVARKNLPTVKEVKAKEEKNNQWKFGVIVFILIYIAFVRVSNSNNFRVFLLSVFNLKLSRKIWEDQRSFFGFVIIQLFAIYLFIAAMFTTNYMEVKGIKLFDSPLKQFAFILVIITIVYFGKFIIHASLGWLLSMHRLGISFVANTISVNNFIALVIFPFTVLTIYVTNDLWANILSQTIIVIFFLSVIYRGVRIVLLSNSFFSFPTFYLFLYLCALEIAPWFIIVKFLTSYSI